MSEWDTLVVDPDSIVWPESWSVDRARVASLSRSRPADDPELVEVRNRLALKRVARRIAEAVNEAPPLPAPLEEKLVRLIRSRGATIDAAKAAELGLTPPSTVDTADPATREAA